MEDRKALVTGASSGIGREIALRLAAKGYRVTLVGRSPERLQEVQKAADSPCELLPADLSDREACRQVAETILREKPEVVVNNAGFGEFGDVGTRGTEGLCGMIDVNVTALTILTEACARLFRERGSGYLMNVASIAGLLPGGPHMAGYYATKAYVTSLTGAVAQELREAGCHAHVCMLCPGPVDTRFNAVANVEFALPGISAEKCAEIAVNRMFAGKEVIIPGVLIRASAMMTRLLPRRLYLRLLSGQQRKKGRI